MRPQGASRRTTALDAGPGPWVLSPGPFNTSNIAEGYERDTDKDRVKFLSYAKGSCAELRTQVYIGMEAGYIARNRGREWIRETETISRMLYGLMRSIRP